MLKSALFLSATLFLAAPAHAATFTPPEGCTGWMTVQARACRVSNYFKCTADAPGDQWRADFDQEGIYFQSRIDFEGQWVESIDIPDMTRQTLDPNPADPASYSDLLSAGIDTFAFNLSRDAGPASRVNGQDALTGQTVTIDGITLEQTQFEFTETGTDGTILRRSRGNEYINRDWRLFFSGPGEADFGDGTFVPIDGSPMQFIFPGEPGFFATQPLFECDALTATGPSAAEILRVRN